MLQIEPEKRITIQEIKKHAYFAGIDFDQVSEEGFSYAKDLIEQKLNEIKQEKKLAKEISA